MRYQASMQLTSPAIHYWQSPLLPGIELCRAHHRDFSYGRHVHLDYHIGLVQQGGQRFIHKGRDHDLVAGRLSLVNPDEVHDGLSLLPDGYVVRVFSLPQALMAQYLPQMGEQFFSAPMLSHPLLYRRFALLHACLERVQGEALPVEEELLQLLAELFALPECRHGLADPQLRLLRDYLLPQLDARHGLDDMAALLGLDRFAFLRQFKARTGMTPYAWLKRLRLEQAKRLLGSGLAASKVALAVGFFDQSHFHHGFRQAFGLTPAQFRLQMLA